MNDSMALRVVMEWSVREKRDRGRPKNRWIDGI